MDPKDIIIKIAEFIDKESKLKNFKYGFVEQLFGSKPKQSVNFTNLAIELSDYISDYSFVFSDNPPLMICYNKDEDLLYSLILFTHSVFFTAGIKNLEESIKRTINSNLISGGVNNWVLGLEDHIEFFDSCESVIEDYISMELEVPFYNKMNKRFFKKIKNDNKIDDLTNFCIKHVGNPYENLGDLIEDYADNRGIRL